ncbi:hypothetical protein [Tepidibacter hydrothermalis]|uniref:Uncharacterized protein n=1 Tax=Tepidibacter hydrothermalis TaxID=3036126 RepID=A0ABY8ED53_9FIRM|nr:hypothetical protein [Tepidibacter hydrothermalis]WFD10866.1 hypothetical protein P4S50_01965 [Tepidibacter hydrothermalis]
MKKMNTKTKRARMIATLLVVGIILIGAIYVKISPKDTNKDILIEEKTTHNTVVDAIEVPKEEVVKVEVSKIKEEVVIRDTDHKVEKEVIKEPLSKEPEKPQNTPPEKKPQTKDDVEDMIKEPEYEKEEVIYIPEDKEEPKMKIESKTNDTEKSNLVPDSQNPFLQEDIPSNGDGGKIKGSDLGDGEWGTGDKF